METVNFYFCFRSGYSWLAMHRIGKLGAALQVRFMLIPVVPSDESIALMKADTRRKAYKAEDVARYAAAYGLRYSPPSQYDTDWMRPHAAFLYAQDNKKGETFALQASEARFSRGIDVGTDEGLAQLARECDLDAESVITAADDTALHQRVRHGIARSREEGLFGVPFFVYRDQHFWGNDRIEWLIDAIQADHGKAEVAL